MRVNPDDKTANTEEKNISSLVKSRERAISASKGVMANQVKLCNIRKSRVRKITNQQAETDFQPHPQHTCMHTRYVQGNKKGHPGHVKSPHMRPGKGKEGNVGGAIFLRPIHIDIVGAKLRIRCPGACIKGRILGIRGPADRPRQPATLGRSLPKGSDTERTDGSLGSRGVVLTADIIGCFRSFLRCFLILLIFIVLFPYQGGP